MRTAEERPASSTDEYSQQLRLALPQRHLALEQDAEWCVFDAGNGWEEVRFHDYGDVYAIPGLYEKLFYETLQCNSPATVRRLLLASLASSGETPRGLRVLDVGAGNGMVGEELASIGVNTIVGVDIVEQAVRALDRDRPGIYEAYFITDLTDLPSATRQKLAQYRFNCLTCVAALGFGDIPPRAFTTAYNLVATGGWIAFNIKEDFLNGSDATGFSGVIATMISQGILEVTTRERYQHRVATNGAPLHYVAVIGRKAADVPETMLE